MDHPSQHHCRRSPEHEPFRLRNLPLLHPGMVLAALLLPRPAKYRPRQKRPLHRYTDVQRPNPIADPRWSSPLAARRHRAVRRKRHPLPPSRRRRAARRTLRAHGADQWRHCRTRDGLHATRPALPSAGCIPATVCASRMVLTNLPAGVSAAVRDQQYVCECDWHCRTCAYWCLYAYTVDVFV